MVVATSTRSTLVVPVYALALELCQTVTATSPLIARVTRTMRLATSTKRTSEVRARVLMGLSHTITVILIPVLITHTLVLATSTGSTSVVPVYALELAHTVTATSLLIAQLTCTMRLATSTKRTSEVRARVLTGLSRTITTVI